MKTRDYLDAICAKYSCTDYKAADLLGVSRSAVSRYRNERDGFGEDTAIRAAELLGLLPAGVVIDTLADRARSPKARQILRDAAATLRRSAAAAALVTVPLMAGALAIHATDAHAATGAAHVGKYTLCAAYAFVIAVKVLFGRPFSLSPRPGL